MRMTLLVFFTVVANSTAQIFLKRGMTCIIKFSETERDLLYYFTVATNVNIVLGVALFVLGLISWLIALTDIEVSLAYPLLSSGYIVTVLLAYIFLGESISLRKLIGILVICAGVAILSSSK